MSKSLEIIDLAQASQVQLRLRNEEGQRVSPGAAFQHPLEDSDQAEIGWYFREYLDRPFGPAKERAEAVETGLRNLGRFFFEAVFRATPESREIYRQAGDEGLESCRLVIISQRPEFLGLPWEVINSPEAGYLASQFASIARQSVDGPLPQFTSPLPVDQLNVLVVSPQPASDSETLSGSLVTETTQFLESLNVQVKLDYLRPPTFGALEQQLSQRPQHYHLAHLDAVACAPDGNSLAWGDSRDYTATVDQLAEMFCQAGVPAVLVTASYGDDASGLNNWAALASRLAQGGVPQVVCLPHPLHDGPTREKFLRPLYQSLVQGVDIPAVAARSRQALMDDPRRSTMSGKQVFWDWTIPTVYQSQEYHPRAIEAEQPSPLTPPVVQPQEESPPELQLPAAGQHGVIGRQAETRHLEHLLRQHSVVLLTGNTGVGKTELALGLGRWVQHTAHQDRPGGVFYSTFEASHPAGLERIVHEIGTAISGLDFADLPLDRQRDWVVDYLRQNPSLLIWDNLENVAGFPTGAAGLLGQEEQQELGRFLADVTQNSQTWALLVSRRRTEPWLSVSHAAWALPGLSQRDRIELAGAILEKAGVEGNRTGPECLDLLDLVQGHPLAMQIALPLLKDVPSSVLRGELEKTIESLPESSQEEGRDDCLTGVMEYAWSRMSHRHRTHLPFLALFQRRVMMDILTHITQEQVYRSVLGEQLGWGACRTLLRTALASGFLEPVSPSVYQVHPAVPWFLGRKLAQQAHGPGISQLEREFVRVYADTADYFMESLYENQDSGVTAVLAEEGNLTQALGLALEAGQWDNAQLLVQPLAQVYRMQKRFPELRRLRHQLLESVGQTWQEAQANNGIDLWLYLLGTQGSESVELGYLDHAEELNQQLLDYLTSQPDGESDPRTAAVHHQLGQVALRRWQLDAAAGWFQKSLAIIEGSDDRAAVADDYFALGQVKQYQRYYTEAKEWYQKALDIHQRLPDEEEMLKDYRALGLVCQLKFEYQEAENWYHRARDLAEENRDEETAILVYHELGTVAHAQYFFDSAVSWYQQALHLSDRLGKEEQMAIEFHHLGLITQARGILYDEAEEWYLAALDKWEKLGNRKAIGDECRQLGVLFHEQKRYEDAEKWYHQAREVFEEIGDVQRAARTYGQLGMIAEEQDNLTGALEWVARTYQTAEEYNLPVLVQVKAHMGRLRDKYGVENFTRWWQDFTGREPPTDLEVDTSAIL